MRVLHLATSGSLRAVRPLLDRMTATSPTLVDPLVAHCSFRERLRRAVRSKQARLVHVHDPQLLSEHAPPADHLVVTVRSPRELELVGAARHRAPDLVLVPLPHLAERVRGVLPDTPVRVAGPWAVLSDPVSPPLRGRVVDQDHLVRGTVQPGDVGMLSSSRDAGEAAVPWAVAHAMAMGVPVVSGDRAMHPLVPAGLRCGDRTEARRLATALTADATRLGQASDDARRWGALRYEIGAVAADIEELYGELLADRPLPVRVPRDDWPHVSVVISTFNRRSLLTRTLDHLAAQSYPRHRMDVVVVDNGSTDGTSEQLRTGRWPFALTVVRNEENRSPAQARNTGIAHVAGDVVAFTDDDCRPTPTWLETLISGLRDDVALVQGRTLPDPQQVRGPTSRSQTTVREHGLYETCNIAYRRDVLARLGARPFATDLPTAVRRLVGNRLGAQAFGEDVQLAWRVKRDGATSRFAHDALVHHHVFVGALPYLMRRSALTAGFPLLVGAVPELRETFLWHRWFLHRRRPLTWMALAGVAATRWRPATALLCVPWLMAVVRPHRTGDRIRRVRQVPVRAILDVVESAALAYGSVRTRRPVL